LVDVASQQSFATGGTKKVFLTHSRTRCLGTLYVKKRAGGREKKGQSEGGWKEVKVHMITEKKAQIAKAAQKQGSAGVKIGLSFSKREKGRDE